jgi:DNA-binding transcriptional ArsR family regulator
MLISPMSSASTQLPDADPAPVFAALGDRTRLSLLMKLSDGQTQSIARLAADTKLTRQAITKHLHVLEQAGLVNSIRVGRESQFAYKSEPIAEAKSYLDMVSAQWDDALSRLHSFVES